MHIKFCSARIALCIAITFSRPQLITHKRLETAREYAPSTTLSSIMPRVRGSAVANGKLDGPSLPAKGKEKGLENPNTSLGEEMKVLPAITEKAKATIANNEKEKDAQETGQPGEPKHKKTKTTGREAAIIYWDGLAKEASLPADTVKKVFSAVKRVAWRDLQHEDNGTFKVYGICELKMKQLPGRPAKVRRMPNGADITVAEKGPHKKICAKPLKEFTQGLVD